MIVYLIRHGHTPLCGTDCLRGRLDEPMDDKGRAGAESLAELFAGVGLVAIVASPLERALVTAQTIARSHGLRVTTDAGLIDRGFGPWEGKPRKLVEDRYGSIDDAPPDEIESRAEVARRALAAWDALTQDRLRSPLALVTHEAVIQEVIRHRCDNCRDLGEKTVEQPPGSWNRIVLEGASCRCDVLGAAPGDGNLPERSAA